MATKKLATTTKVPKTVKTPSDQGSKMAASADGNVVVAKVASDALARLDTTTWKLQPWPVVDGFVNDLSISPDATRVAVGVTGHATAMRPHIELRSTADGIVTARFLTTEGKLGSCNPRGIDWSPSARRLVAVIEASVEKEFQHIAIVDVGTGAEVTVDLDHASHIAAVFVDDDHVMAVSRKEGDSAGRIVRIDATTGAVSDVGTHQFDLPKGLQRIGRDRFLFITEWDGWRLVDATLAIIAEGPKGRFFVVDGSDLVSAEASTVTRTPLNEGGAGQKTKAKKRIDGLTVGGGHVLLMQTGQIEVLPPG